MCQVSLGIKLAVMTFSSYPAQRGFYFHFVSGTRLHTTFHHIHIKEQVIKWVCFILMCLVYVRVKCKLDTQNKHSRAVHEQKMKLNKWLNPELLWVLRRGGFKYSIVLMLFFPFTEVGKENWTDQAERNSWGKSALHTGLHLVYYAWEHMWWFPLLINSHTFVLYIAAKSLYNLLITISNLFM